MDTLDLALHRGAAGYGCFLVDAVMRIQNYTINLCGALFADPALAADPRPPQLQITFLSEPAPIVQYGSTKLVYEMEVTNFSKRSYVFDSIDAKAGGAPFSFSGTTLAGMMAHLGP